MECLEFQVLKFNKRPAINVTFRRGLKWYEKLSAGDEFFYGEPGCGSTVPSAGVGLCVLSLRFDALKYIPPTLLAYAHDPVCRTSKGLLEKMKGIYGPDVWDDTITVLIFTVQPF